MVVSLDHFNVSQKQTYVVVAVTIGLVLSIVTYIARLYAKMTFNKRMYREDYWMGAALFFSCSVAACLFYRMSVRMAWLRRVN